MDRERAMDVCNSFGHPVIKDKNDNVVASFARTDKETVKGLENLDDESLMDHMKTTHFLIHDYGCFGITDLQYEQLLYLELEERDMLDEFKGYVEEKDRIREETKKKFKKLDDEELVERCFKEDDMETENLYHEELARRDMYHLLYDELNKGESE